MCNPTLNKLNVSPQYTQTSVRVMCVGPRIRHLEKALEAIRAGAEAFERNLAAVAEALAGDEQGAE